ncbi:RHS domain-containing protein [Klebsiella pneumoniae]|nr:RHS domain-containing protein [Klebsiella quasipneumoniae]EKZ5698766.1 RHS domain-containing protein [Klebsiella quasipneumoniae]EKZ5834188.1 RHS domain-containing protein [Klebsiella variicola]EKZ9490805.1 RHS domain-containing protein [Enterobacter hormaechei]
MSTEVDKMRFNTIIDAHSFMKNYRSGEEQGKGTPVGDALYPVASYGDGRYVSRICFKYLGATGDYDPTTCTGDPATVYWRSTYVLPGEMDKTPFLDRDLGLPTTTMCVGNPIHLGTGNKFQAELDYQSGGSDPFTFTRYYNSHLPDEELGGWRHTYSRSVEVNASKYGENMVVLHRPEGQQLAFYNSSSVWVPTWKTDDTLTKDATGWRYTQSDGVVEAYDETGRLTGIEKPNGNHITLSYLNGELSSITDGFGRNIQFQHQDGRMVSVTDPAGGSIQYQYNSAGKLAEVIYQDNTSRSYLYDDPNAPGLLSGLVDENGNRFATWGYDAQGMAVLSEHAGGAEKTQVSYNADGSVSVTNALGHVQRYTYSRHNGMLKPDVVEGAPCTGFVGGKETYVYDSKGLVSSITDRAGQKRTFTHNDRGLETTQIDQDGGKVTTDWLPSKSLPAKITEPTRITELTYDTHLRVISRKVTDRSSGASRTWTYTYAPVGTGKPSLLASVDGPRTDVSDVTTFDYDDQGNLIRTTNALGQVMQFGDYDANGRAGTIQGVNGVTQTLTYDARGRLVSSTGPEGTTAYNYDAVGLLSSLTKPNGATVSYEYDAAHRLVAETDAQGNRRELELNDLGNPVEERLLDALGQTRWIERRIFNEIGWLSSVSDAYSNQSSFSYDVVANLIQETSPSGNTHSYKYDGFHHRTQTTDPLGKVTQVLYKDTGDVYRVSDPRSRLTYYSYNGFGEVTQVRSPDTGTTDITYDEAGNVATRKTAKGQTTSYSYDALNRIIEASSGVAGESPILYGYDEATSPYGMGRLTSVDDGNGVRRYGYTPEGWLAYETWETHGQSLTTQYQYDGAGLITKITYPSGREVSYTRDLAGDVIEVATTQAGTTTSLASQIERAPFGPVTSMVRWNGISESRSLDLNYRVTGIDATRVHSLVYRYNHLDQRVTKTLNGQTRLLIYGLAGNLIEELDAATGDVLAEYIWLDGTPLSFAQSGQTYQVHVDHLGTPKALTDASGQVVWKASYSPFGKASITTQGPTFNLRFPGQYYDAETGLHYNWRRYYDPNTGRYITSDPIGLAGGINTYAYALSNPIGNADPTGEFVPLLLGAYVAIDFALSAWDAYDTFKTITSDCATSREKWISGGLFAAGIILPGNYKALGNVAERAFKNTADDFVDLASSQRRKHILDGDATGGGHRAGTGKPGKSEFPQSWSDEKIMHVISDIATDPNVSRKAGRGGRTIAEAVKEGINVRVIQESNGDIVSGFPTNVPRNPK